LGQGLLESKWRIEEARPRRYYLISEEGRRILPVLRAEWEKMVHMMDAMFVG
jgi:DNA-binding PadR family transcriptional regulator